MDKGSLIKLSSELLVEAILNMGHIIRTLDEDGEYLDYWTQDGEYIIHLPGDELRKHLRLQGVAHAS